MASKHIKIRPDLESCDKIPAKRLTIQLPDPLAAILSKLLMLLSNTYVPIRTSLTLTAIVFVANLLHLLVMYLYYRFRCLRDLVPNFVRTPSGNVPIKPLVTVDSSHSKAAATYVDQKENSH